MRQPFITVLNEGEPFGFAIRQMSSLRPGSFHIFYDLLYITAGTHPAQRIYMHLSEAQSDNFISATFFHITYVPGLAIASALRCRRPEGPPLGSPAQKPGLVLRAPCRTC